MRVACALLVIAALTSTGCSALVAHSGTQVSRLGDRDAVHDTFGPPTVVVETEDGRFLEEFVTRRKIAESWKIQGIVMVGFWTCSLSELYYLPTEVFHATRNSVFGQRFQVEYNQAGRVVVMYRDGEEIWGTRFRHDQPAIDPPPPPYFPAMAAQATTTGTARFHFTAPLKPKPPGS